MRVIIIGASKGIGRQTVKAALEAGHTVTAFSRRPSALKLSHPKLRLQAGNVLDMKPLEQAIAGQDAVICTLGLPTLKAIGPPFAKPSYVLSEGTANILKVMASQKVKRFICVTAIGASDSVKQCTPAARLVFRYGLRWLFKQKDQQEDIIKKSRLEWTIIRPTALTNGRQSGALLAEDLRSGVLTQVSRADVAAVLVKIIGDAKTYKKALVLSYPARLGDSVRWVAGYFGIG